MPNAELANSTGPFGLAFAQMFNPTVGTIVMALAVIACLGSLLGWQFTIAQTGKSAAEERMFPAFFAKVNRMGAPITGMIVLGVVQTLFALSTISPTLSEQFSALVNLAVVTNVIPYVVALSSLMVIMKAAKAPKELSAQHASSPSVAMAYSVFALYASGKDAVMGGMLVLGITYIVWGFIAPRFAACRRSGAGSHCLTVAPNPKGDNHASSTTEDWRPCIASLAAARDRACRSVSRSAPRCRHRRNAGAHPGGRPHQARLPRRRAPVLVRNEAGHPKATRSRCASRSPTGEDAARAAEPGRRLGAGDARRPPRARCSRAASISCARRRA